VVTGLLIVESYMVFKNSFFLLDHQLLEGGRRYVHTFRIDLTAILFQGAVETGSHSAELAVLNLRVWFVSLNRVDPRIFEHFNPPVIFGCLLLVTVVITANLLWQ
jgi:hypothetical protein